MPRWSANGSRLSKPRAFLTSTSRAAKGVFGFSGLAIHKVQIGRLQNVQNALFLSIDTEHKPIEKGGVAGLPLKIEGRLCICALTSPCSAGSTLSLILRPARTRGLSLRDIDRRYNLPRCTASRALQENFAGELAIAGSQTRPSSSLARTLPRDGRRKDRSRCRTTSARPASSASAPPSLSLSTPSRRRPDCGGVL